MTTDSFKTIHCSFRCNFVSGEKGQKKENEKWDLYLIWDTNKQKSPLHLKKVVNEESERAHYDNMQHNIKSFVLLLKGPPVSNALGLDVCEKQCQEQKQMQINKNMSIRL